MAHLTIDPEQLDLLDDVIAYYFLAGMGGGDHDTAADRNALRDVQKQIERARENEPTYAVWTRYETPTGQIVRHAFGPYPKDRARTERRRMLREAEERGLSDKVEISTVRFFDDWEMR
jgi:hypothetical protein